MTILEIVPDEEIDAHHYGRFGDATPRSIVNEGVLKAMLGYSSGHTVTTILLRHSLIHGSAFIKTPRLTKKGMKYARALFGGMLISELASILPPTPDTSPRDKREDHKEAP